MLPPSFVDWCAHAPEQPSAFGPLALFRQQVEDAGFRLTVIEDRLRAVGYAQGLLASAAGR